MGQYYSPVSIEKKEHVYSHDYGSGLKLMEHSWMKNNFVRAVETLIAKDGAWHGDHIVWAGDYADPEPEIIDPRDSTKKVNLFFICESEKRNPEIPDDGVDFRYLVNITKMEFVDKTKVPYDRDGWQIHPLPLLTCEGNGRGGGDYHGESQLIGAWARDVIFATNDEPANCNEIIFDLIE